MKKHTHLVLSLFLGLTLNAYAEDDDAGLGYDGILNELSSSADEADPDYDPFNDVMIHGGFGLTSTYVNVAPPTGSRRSGVLSGFEAAFGIDLFSRNWMAEGGVRSFSSDRIGSNSRAGLREFDLKLIYKGNLSRRLIWRGGLGLAARYLKYSAPDLPAGRMEQTTPSWIFLTGFDVPLNRTFSVGAEVAMRTPMIQETIDRSAVDAGFRFATHF